MGIRDSQRSKVYVAEKSEGVFSASSTQKHTLDQCQAFVDSVTRSTWWKRRCSTRKVIVEASARYGRAWATYDNRIRTSPESRRNWIMCHELAHIMTHEQYGVAAHGPQYCANYVSLVRMFLSKEEGDALKTSMRKHRVKVRGVNAASISIKRTCANCGQKFIVGTGWSHPKVHETFHSKSCAQAWFVAKLTKQQG